MFKRKTRSSEEISDILPRTKKDRRILPFVPDAKNVRSVSDRRGGELNQNRWDVGYLTTEAASIRYLCDFEVQVTCRNIKSRPKWRFKMKCVDISGTGLLLLCEDAGQQQKLQSADEICLKFTIPPGVMPEGFENKVNLQAKCVRVNKDETSGALSCGLVFAESLVEYVNRFQGRRRFLMSLFLLSGVVLFIVLMRLESVIYFRFNKGFYLYSIIAAVFLLSRYVFGMLYRPVPVDPDYTPGVSVIIPCFNEEEWLGRTIISCMNQDYPSDKLQVIVVDDCSTDRSVEKIRETVELIHGDDELLNTKGRISYVVMEKNGGKREALALGVEHTRHELIVFVDSDSFLNPFAVRNLVQPFQDPKMGGVAGRTDVANVYTNWITKMQATRYYIAFRIMKAAESYFDTVTCLSGPLACYRKTLVMENLHTWRNQTFLGAKATFGDDRSLTNLILRKNRTYYQDTAICSTIVPNRQKVFLKQQMRWKRSWLRESAISGSFIWKKEPFAALFFYMGFVVPFVAPVIVVYNMFYVPLTHRVFPFTFIVGIMMMSLLMSFAYLLFKRSSIWLWSAFFCLYYEAVLLWQMPVAWVTFWKSTWGTRMTPEDVLEKQRKKERKKQRGKDRVPVRETNSDVAGDTLTTVTDNTLLTVTDNILTMIPDNTLTTVADDTLTTVLDDILIELADISKDEKNHDIIAAVDNNCEPVTPKLPQLTIVKEIENPVLLPADYSVTFNITGYADDKRIYGNTIPLSRKDDLQAGNKQLSKTIELPDNSNFVTYIVTESGDDVSCYTFTVENNSTPSTVTLRTGVIRDVMFTNTYTSATLPPAPSPDGGGFHKEIVKYPTKCEHF
jgi:hyaluronan synthase